MLDRFSIAFGVGFLGETLIGFVDWENHSTILLSFISGNLIEILLIEFD
jgi:hypothetical protein